MSAVIILTIISFILGVILFVVDHFFSKSDKEKQKILSLLPGINCGSCGYGGCSSLADAILKGDELPEKCRLLKPDKKKELEDYLKTLRR